MAKTFIVESRFPRAPFLAALHKFNTARGPRKQTKFQAALKEARWPEEARLLFVWTGVRAESHRAALKHWENVALDYAHAAKQAGLPWEALRYFHALAPSGSTAEKMFDQLWFNHPDIQAWLAKPVGSDVSCATPIS